MKLIDITYTLVDQHRFKQGIDAKIISPFQSPPFRKRSNQSARLKQSLWLFLIFVSAEPGRQADHGTDKPLAMLRRPSGIFR